MLCHKTQLQTLLSRHIGCGNGITAQAVAQLIDVPPRQVRHLVTELRMDGIAVCGTPRDGYYIAASGEELEATCQFLRSRAMHSLVLESRLRNVPLPDLIGQMKLPT